MQRGDRLVLLAVLGVSVLLAGLELMITAVALPAILVDLASWTELRLASWIVNGYLIVSIVAMPIAGRLVDLLGVRPLLLGALALFVVGSLVSGAAPSLELLIAGRLVQGAGGGALVPVATAAAAELFDGRARARAIGVVGSLTFVGMAVGPLAGAWILERVDPAGLLSALGRPGGAVESLLSPAWRWVFYVNVPIGIAALALGWAASAGWATSRRDGSLDAAGSLLVGASLATLLAGVTLVDGTLGSRLLDPAYPPTLLVASGLVTGLLAVRHALRRPDPFLDLRILRRPVVAAAGLVALLTGYALATALVGGAVFVDRVRYAGPETQQIVLGALGGAAAVAALAAGFLLDRLPAGPVTVAGVVAAAGALAAMGAWGPATGTVELAATAAAFGAGFGMTLTSRSTAAIEAAGSGARGLASATVTVARMAGMALGLAVLTAYGSTTIERLSADVFATPEAYVAYLPTELRDRPLEDPLVVAALEDWAAREAATVLADCFAVGAFVTAIALLPAVALGRRRTMLGDDG